MKKLLFTLIIAILSLGKIFAQTPQLSVQSISPDVIITNEETDLVVTLINKGDAATEGNTVVTLSSDNPYLTIIENNVIYETIGVNATQEGKFVVKVNPMIADNSIIDLNVEIINEGIQVLSKLTFGFEGGIEGWTNIDADGDGFQWVESGMKLGPTYGHESEYCMFSQSYDNYFEVLYPDNYLVSPEKYKVGKDASISFWACAQDKNYPYEHFGVAVSTKGNSSASDFVTIQEWTLDSVAPNRVQGEWGKFTSDLSDYEGQEIWIAIRHFNCFDQYFIAVDDIEIDNIYQAIKYNDSISLGIVSPTPNIVFKSFECEPITAGKTFDIDVTVINKGSAATTYESKVVLTTEDEFVNMIETEDIIGALEFNGTATATFSFSTSEEMPKDHIINFNLNVAPAIVYDENISFTYTFEDDTEGWTSIDANNDEHTWYHTSDYDVHDILPIISYSGHGHIMSESSCNALFPYTQLTTDDYIVSPTLIGVTKNTTIDLWAAAQDEDSVGDHFGIAVSMQGNSSADDFTTIDEWDLKIKETRAGDWINYSADLSKYEGMFVYVAIRHFKSEEGFTICVDDVTVNDFARYYNWNSSFVSSNSVSLEENHSDFNIYPNPVENMLFLATELHVEEIAIYDIYGRICCTDASNASTLNASTSNAMDTFNVSIQDLETMDTFNVSVQDLETGIYFIKIKTDKEVIIRQFIKK